MAEPTSPIVFIYKELFERYEELKNLGKWLGGQPRFVVVGQPDAAPAELYTALWGAPKATAEGRDWVAVAGYTLDDVPGLGRVGHADDGEQALAYVREADVVLLPVLVGRRPTETERGLFDHLRRLKKLRTLVVTAPADGAPAAEPVPLDEESWEAWVREYRRLFDDAGLTVLPCRGLASVDLVKLVRSISDREEFAERDRLVLPAMVTHPACRDALVLAQVQKSAVTAMWLGLSPIPFSDVAAITPLQVILVSRVAAAYGHKLTLKQAKEFLAACAGVTAAGFGFRTLFRQIAGGLGEGLLPLKLAVGAGMGWTGTQLVGRAARLYFRSAGAITPAEAAQQAKAELAEEAPRLPFGRKPAPNANEPDESGS